MKKTILLDLDGTLTESGEGIIKSVQYALEKMGRPEKNQDKLKVFIGPPIIEQFIEFAGLDKENAKVAVKHYRERFSKIGIFENRLYPGIEDLLNELKEKGNTLAVASSKPEVFVKQILEHFKLTHFFREIVGSTMDETRTTKSEVICEALERLNMKDKRNEIIMVGDKKHDVEGARKHGVYCIAVSYGYGTLEELEKTSPDKIVNTVYELKKVLLMN